MNTKDIRTLYTFNSWANQRLTVVAGLLDPDEFTRDLKTSYGSVKGTLVHILWGEWIWLQRWRGESPKRIFLPEEFADLPAIETQWNSLQRDQHAFIADLTDERLADAISYENLRGERWEYSLGHMMQHIVNHSSYHRGQVVTLLRQLGKTPPSTDFLLFFDEVGQDDAS